MSHKKKAYPVHGSRLFKREAKRQAAIRVTKWRASRKVLH